MVRYFKIKRYDISFSAVPKKGYDIGVFGVPKKEQAFGQIGHPKKGTKPYKLYTVGTKGYKYHTLKRSTISDKSDTLKGTMLRNAKV